MARFEIVGTNEGAGQWVWNLTIRAQTPGRAQEVAAAIHCQPVQTGDRLQLAVIMPRTMSNVSVESSFEIYAPGAATVTCANHFGETRISGLQGNVEASGQNGPLTIENIGGEVRAKTTFAALKASDIGPANLSSQNGELKVTEVHGSLTAGTSFSSLTARHVAGPAKLHNQNGELRATDIQGPLDAVTSFSRLDAENIAGPVTLRNQNGAIHAKAAAGNADIKTSFADLTVEDIRGDASLENRNGPVNVSGVTGMVTARTSFAPLSIEGAGEAFNCQNQYGRILIRATSPALASIQARTSFSPIELRLPAALKPAISAHTSFAEVNSDFPIPANSQSAAAPEAAPGTPRITLENQNGSIRIKRDE